ncbi:MAG: glucose-1-phosphate thymidylyltransferase [Firmicutes bacterium]|nr:glucose-1-phosphate thymidylyltransferase [Bacillota bacterium]
MKGLILSGGKGTRLRPLTHTSAKQLIPIANKPVLFYAVEAMVDAGIKDIGIIVGETKDEIEEAVGDGSTWGAKIKYILQEEPRGLAHAVLVAKDYLDGEPFVMFLGDNLIKGGIVDFVAEFRKEKPNALILLTPVKNPSEFGVAELIDGRVVRLEEKPKEPKSNLALVGVYIFDKNIMKAASSIKPSLRDELEITDAIQHLIDSGLQVKPHIVKGWWKDTGKLEDILEANRILLEGIEPEIIGKVDEKSKIFGRVRIEKGAEIINSNIRGPAVIGENTKIIDSYIGPFTSVYYNVSITKSEIEHSIILENSTLLEIGSRLEDSLIGKDVTVYKVHTKPKAYKLMLGDHSLVGII